MRQSTAIWPGTGRITLALLAVVAAAMAYPWHVTRERWVLGVAAAVVIVLLARWRGLYLTTMLRRRLAMTRGKQRPVREAATDARTTALLYITAPPDGPDVLPLSLMVRYLDRYGIRADAIRVTSRDTASDNGTPQRQTWIGLTMSAANNLAALQARSPKIPLHATAEVAARRLADHLREIGWETGIAAPDDIPLLVTPKARETWRSVAEDSDDYVAAYGISTDDELPDVLAAVWSYPADETWTALEIAGAGTDLTLAVACAYRTDKQPHDPAPLPHLTPQSGNQRAALTALNPLSTKRLDGHTEPPVDLLTRLNWPSSATTGARVPSGPRHAATTRT